MTKETALNILGLGRKYTKEEAKLAYRKLARKYHPDIAGPSYGTKFAQINEAYELISNSEISSGCILTHKTMFDMERV